MPSRRRGRSRTTPSSRRPRSSAAGCRSRVRSASTPTPTSPCWSWTESVPAVYRKQHWMATQETLVPAAGEGQPPEEALWLDEMTPRQIVAELDKYIVGQQAAKKSVAIALRNRWRRQRVAEELREEIVPANIIMIGPTGVGKTEIARRMARLAGAPFVKVEASKFTEVGYVGRDVESMIRDLIEYAVNMVRDEREMDVEELAEQRTEERLLDLLLPTGDDADAEDGARPGARAFVVGREGIVPPAGAESENGGGESAEDRERLRERRQRTREKLRKLLREGQMEDRIVDIDVQQSVSVDGMM